MYKYAYKIIVALIFLPISLFAFYLAFVYIFDCNKEKALSRNKVLEDSKEIVIPIKPAYIDSYNENKLVHVIGYAFKEGSLTDKTFKISVPYAIKLRRVVEMYDRYEWSKVSSSSMPVQRQTWVAEPVTLGKFTLSSSLVAKLNRYESIRIMEKMFMQMPKRLYNRKLHLDKGGYYLGDNPSHPQSGDLRIKFEMISPKMVSIVAKQVGSRLSAYQTSSGYIELLEYGEVDAKRMLTNAKIGIDFSRIILYETQRFSHVFFIIFVGIYILFFALGILENRGWIYIAVIAATVSHFLIALFWIKYMPILAIILMVIAVSFLGLLKFARQLHEVPKLELPESMLVPEEKVPEKKI